MATPSTAPFPLTADEFIDAATHGYYWNLDASRTLKWAIADGWSDEYWLSPTYTASVLRQAFEVFSYYANIKFQFVGHYEDPGAAYQAGSDITISMDGAGVVFASSDVWALGWFPYVAYDALYPGAAGDIYLNLNSQANYLTSYDPGSAGFFLAIHEIGHTLGLKHPHDDGGTGRPTLDQLGYGELDVDWFSVMSYNDDYQWNLTAWDPATPMLMDVIALQFLYGQNTSTNSGDSTYTLPLDGLYATIWDASGNDLIDASSSSVGWRIELPIVQLSPLVSTLAGLAIPVAELSWDSPTNFYWLTGNIERVIGSSYSDEILGNDLSNTLFGNYGDDFLWGGEGNDITAGGEGFDTAAFVATQASYTVVVEPSGRTAVAYDPRGGDGLDILTGIEQTSFAGVTSALAPTNSILEYTASYADLFDAFGFDRQAAFDHFVNHGYAEGRNVTFSALEYLASYNDLLFAFGTNQEAGAWHYLSYGRAEGRGQGSFDGLEYIASNPDLIAAFGADQDAGAWHYIALGKAEGRGVGTFDGLEYVAANPDLILAFAVDRDAGSRHYINTGYAEGRGPGDFDGLQYIASYPDLIRAFSANGEAGTLHYINNGYTEGRDADDFDAARYLENYPDLQAAFGTNEEAATVHYILYGFAEGRVDVLV